MYYCFSTIIHEVSTVVESINFCIAWQYIFIQVFDLGADIIQYDAKDEDNDNQRWSWVGDAKEKRLKSKSSGKVLDIGEGDKVVQKSSSDKAKTQLWEAVEIKK